MFILIECMVKIDLKDRKILYELDLDARQSLTHIGKKVGLKKDVISYRIKRMQDEGIIKNFWTVIDAYKLGFIVFRFYIVFQYVTPEKKNEIIDYFVNYKNSWAVISAKGGGIDLALVLWVKDLRDFNQFWMKTLDKYGDYFAEKIFSAYLQAQAYRHSYLLLEDYKESERLAYESVEVGKTIEIDELDRKILNEIALNARIPLIDLAEKFDCSSQTINYRLNTLMKSGVIQGFRTTIDVSKLGFEHFKVDIYLKEHKQREPIINYFKKNPYLIYLNTSAGFSDIEFEFVLENVDKLNLLMEEISSKFPNAIRKYTYFTTQQVHKIRFMPEL